WRHVRGRQRCGAPHTGTGFGDEVELSNAPAAGRYGT
ncbi:MAG: hypothetical protein V7603_989, partial [Micromonosporaceae bacterium]